MDVLDAELEQKNNRFTVYRPAWQRRRQLGKSAVLVVVAEQRRRRGMQRQRGGGSGGNGQLGGEGSSLAEAQLWRQRPKTTTTPR